MKFAKSLTRKRIQPLIIEQRTDEDAYGLPYSIKNMDELMKVQPWNKEYRKSSSPLRHLSKLQGIQFSDIKQTES